MWEEIEEEIPYPLALGKVFDYDLDSDCPFRLILIASTLHHKDSLSEPQKKSVVRTALEDAMDKAREHHIDTSATGLMVGGWRLSATSAFMAMIEGYETSCQHEDKSNLDIYILNPRDFQIVQSMAVGMGWRG